MISITLFFFVGGAAAVLFRLELMTPARRLVDSETYNKLFTLHGVIMVFFFLIPVDSGRARQFLVPLMIGARDLAFPRLNLASWYIFMLGGRVDRGRDRRRRRRHGLDVLHAVQQHLHQHERHSHGARHVHRRVFVDPHRPEFHRHHAHDAGARADLVSPAAVRLVALRDEPDHGAGHAGAGDHAAAGGARARSGHSAFSIRRSGGDPLLFQHLFWFYSHPAVYIMVLPGMGVISEIVACFSRKRIFGYTFIAFSSLAIAVLGFLVWGHHMFVSGQSVYAGHGVFVPEHAGGDSVGDQGVQLDGHAVQGLDLAATRRCCTRWGSSACSRWAG